jgi:hypothetical protein
MECIKCKAEMITAKLKADAVGTGAYLTNKKKGLFETERRCGVSCFVCPKCGYVELKADAPQSLVID